MKAKRIISSLLAVLMLAGAFSFTTFADEATTSTAPAGRDTTNTEPTIDYFTGKETENTQTESGKDAKWEPVGDKVIFSESDKLDTMTKMLSKNGYVLYVDKFSGEVAVYCEATGEAIFSNPYNIADTASATAESVKEELLSQLVIEFTDIATGQSQTFYSYKDAVREKDNIKGQIVVRNIKNGIRVEYTIGRQEARLLVPQQIEKTRFETQIKDVMEAAVSESEDRNQKFQYDKLISFYSIQDPSTVTGAVQDAMLKKYPITKKMAIYTLDEGTTNAEKIKLEQFIKTYCPDYTYEDLDEDHMLTEFVAEDKNPPLFKMALEYSLDETGLTVRLPANGIRFNEALYRLDSIQILPFMGAGAYSNKEESTFVNNGEGYTFFPDGSGSLFRFDKITNMGQLTAISGKVYGQDYAYHTISGTHQETIRYPVFGIVREEDEALIEYNRELTHLQAEINANTPEGETPAKAELDKPTEKKMNSSGFVAIVEEGDALMELTTYHYVISNEYNTVKMTVYPRPQDTYNIADAISVGESGAEWTVVSSRKYTGNYKVKYIMLSDKEDAAYDTSYVGMAKAYRDYLEKSEVLKRLTDDDVSEDIPLYIETFGAVQTTERVLSIPVDVMTPLATFDDIVTMYDELSDAGVSNINFIMTGYTKGGMTNTQVPYNLKWEKNVSEEFKFEDLVEYAKDNGFGVYPDFDFAYSQTNKMFDGLTLSKHSVKTIDDRYTTRREYSATKQTYVSYFDVAISPAYYSHFYEKLTENYLEFAPMGISVSTLGNALNSDFDEDDPYNREDSKAFTVKAFQYLDENYDKVLTSGGNAYTWQYVDYITDVALDSSRFSQAYASVPFLGMVLHGYVQIAGTPLNMEGNIDYAILKAIENGASLNFILSYRNTNNLKNFEDLSKYYSVRYDIWRDDVISIYDEVNSVLAGVQTSTITGHSFVEGNRIPDDDELIFDAESTIMQAINAKKDYEKALADYEVDKIRNARNRIEAIAELLASYTALDDNNELVESDFTAAMQDYVNAYDSIVSGIYSETEFKYTVKALDDAMNDKIAELLAESVAALKTAKTNMETAQSGYVTSQIILAADINGLKADATALLEKPAAPANITETALAEAIKATGTSESVNEQNEAILALLSNIITLQKAYNDANTLYSKDKSDANKTAFDNAKEELEAELDKYPNLDDNISGVVTSSIQRDGNAVSYAQNKAVYDAAFEAAAKENLKKPETFEKVAELFAQLYTEDAYFGGYMKAAKTFVELIIDLVREVEMAEKYYAIIDASTMSAEYKAIYAAALAEIKADIAELLDVIGYTQTAGADAKKGIVDMLNSILAQLVAPVNYTSVTDNLVDCTDAVKASILPKAENYTFVLPTEPVEGEETTDEEEVDEKEIVYRDLEANDPKEPEAFKLDDAEIRTYESDDCKIVLETYENGTKFLLNFNNYTVEIKPTAENGLTQAYTIGAYGYVVVAQGN